MTKTRSDKSKKDQNYPRVPQTKDEWAPGLFESMEREIDDYKAEQAKPAKSGKAKDKPQD